MSKSIIDSKVGDIIYRVDYYGILDIFEIDNITIFYDKNNGKEVYSFRFRYILKFKKFDYLYMYSCFQEDFYTLGSYVYTTNEDLAVKIANERIQKYGNFEKIR